MIEFIRSHGWWANCIGWTLAVIGAFYSFAMLVNMLDKDDANHPGRDDGFPHGRMLAASACVMAAGVALLVVAP